MIQTATIRRFPRKAVTFRPRGVRGILSPYTSGGDFFGPSADLTTQPWWIPDFTYTLFNQASPDAIYAVNQRNNAEVAKATINPISGQPDPAAVAYALKTQNVAGTALQQGNAVSTGSPLADTVDNLLSNLAGTGTQISAPSSTFPWGTVILIGLLGVGGYVLFKVL